MENIEIKELSEIIQSSNLNFLLGAGTSTPFLPLLGSIERDLDKAKTASEREKLYKSYIKEVMLPNKAIIDEDLSDDDNYEKTKKSYIIFFQSLTELILKRKTTILKKQINIFTTNIDIFLEKVLEEQSIEYNDGFSGKFEPVFNLANFKKSIFQRSLHFDHISEVPLFNIIKLHGSLTWKRRRRSKKIYFSHLLDHFTEDILTETSEAFDSDYKDILIVNPENSKLLQTVLNIYYSELLRMYSSELEKENSILFILGFSMEDQHIQEITLRAAKSNPTLRIFVFCSKTGATKMKDKLETSKHPNIHICGREEDDEKFTLEYFTENIIRKI